MNRIKKNLYKLISNDQYRINIRNAGIFRFPVGYSFQNHEHSEVEVFYVKSGCCVASVEGNYVPLKEGDCLVIRPFVRHGMTVDAKVPYTLAQVEYTMTYSTEYADGISILNTNMSYVKLDNCQNICNIITNISRYYRQSPITDLVQTQIELSMAQLMLELSYHLDLRNQNLKHDKELNKHVQMILNYLNEHYEEDLNIEEIAEKFSISSRYLRRIFEKEIGMSCNNYITCVRIGKAKELLWNTSKSITDIAMMTGFNSSQYFSRVFQQSTGIQPSKYRNMWRGQIADIVYNVETKEKE